MPMHNNMVSLRTSTHFVHHIVELLRIGLLGELLKQDIEPSA